MSWNEWSWVFETDPPEDERMYNEKRKRSVVNKEQKFQPAASIIYSITRRMIMKNFINKILAGLLFIAIIPFIAIWNIINLIVRLWQIDFNTFKLTYLIPIILTILFFLICHYC